MTQDEFWQWFNDSYPALVKVVFRCVQARCGGRYEDAEDGIQTSLTNMLRRWEWFQSRIYRDAAGLPRMRRPDGRPGNLLFSYFVQAACNEGCGHMQDPPPDGDDNANDPPDKGEGALGKLIRDEFRGVFRGCFGGLEPEQQEAIRKTVCNGEPLTSTERGRLRKGRLALQECLARHKWPLPDLIDVVFQMHDVICGTPAPA